MNKLTPTTDTLSLKKLFFIFFRLGCISFGGPVAHIGFFHQEFVTKRKWYSEEAYLQLVSLSQILPGPASSQVGMAIGYNARSYIGSFVSFIGFTLPSALLMGCFAFLVTSNTSLADSSVLYVLKIVALAVVAQAIWTMGKAQCSDRIPASIAILSACSSLYIDTIYIQFIIILIGGIAGNFLCQSKKELRVSSIDIPSRNSILPIILISSFIIILIISPLISVNSSNELIKIFDSLYRSGALVFGGGHVVLPLLESELVSTGRVNQDQFLFGYGLAQAIPGPLFTFASYLGVIAMSATTPLLGGIVASLAIFLPGYLLIIGILPYWQKVANNQKLKNTIKGINAAVIGLLIASFFDPIWLSTIHSSLDIIVALLILSALTIWKLQPLLLVLISITFALLFDFLIVI